jgi:hypothetical protein
METILALATILLAVATFVMAVYTAKMAKHTQRLADESEKASYRQIGVQTWLELTTRFDSPIMIKERIALAGIMNQHQCEPPADARKDISETVMNFFEDAGTLYSAGFIDKNLVQNSFGYYAFRWWKVCKKFVDDERARFADPTLYEKFEQLAAEIEMTGDNLDLIERQIFLMDERNLVTWAA